MAPSAQRDPLAVAALVGAGTLVGHEVGYLADSGANTGHEYFALLAPLAIVGVVIAVWASAVSVLRRGASRVPNIATLAAAQSLLYVGFEIGERTIGATDSPLFSLPVVLGLFAQPLVAWLAVSILKISAAVVARFINAGVRDMVIAAAVVSGSNRSLVTPVVSSSAPARAPPVCF